MLIDDPEQIGMLTAFSEARMVMTISEMGMVMAIPGTTMVVIFSVAGIIT